MTTTGAGTRMAEAEAGRKGRQEEQQQRNPWGPRQQLSRVNTDKSAAAGRSRPAAVGVEPAILDLGRRRKGLQLSKV